jgi:hypothetical protein
LTTFSVASDAPQRDFRVAPPAVPLASLIITLKMANVVASHTALGSSPNNVLEGDLSSWHTDATNGLFLLVCGKFRADCRVFFVSLDTIRSCAISIANNFFIANDNHSKSAENSVPLCDSSAEALLRAPHSTELHDRHAIASIGQRSLAYIDTDSNIVFSCHNNVSSFV